MKYTIGQTFPKNNEIDNDFMNELNAIMINSNPREIDNAKLFDNCDKYNNPEHMNKLIQSYEKFAA